MLEDEDEREGFRGRILTGAITEEVIFTGTVNACAADTRATFTRFGGFKFVLKMTRGF